MGKEHVSNQFDFMKKKLDIYLTRQEAEAKEYRIPKTLGVTIIDKLVDGFDLYLDLILMELYNHQEGNALTMLNDLNNLIQEYREE